MSDPQHFGLGELGQRVQAMSDPANPPKSSPAEPAPADPRLRPYQGAPLPIGSLSSRGPLPSYEPQNDLRTPPPAGPVKPPASQFSPNAAPSGGAAFAQPPSRPFEAAHQPPPASSWEQVAVPEQTGAPQTPSEPKSPASDPAPPSASQLSGSSASGEPPRSGFQRALDAVRSAIPVVQKLLPLIDGNFATAMSALMAPQNHPAPHVEVDLEPVERGLAEVSKSNRELRTQVQEQGTTLKRVEDQLERVREATDRNTLEQQELVEDLRAVGSRISTLAIIGVILLLLSLGLNGYLIFELQHILR
jgi:hypothetical protein